LSLNKIRSVTAGTVVTIIGTLTDSGPDGVFDTLDDKVVPNKPITFAVTQGTTFDINDIETPGPITIATPLDTPQLMV